MKCKYLSKEFLNGIIDDLENSVDAELRLSKYSSERDLDIFKAGHENALRIMRNVVRTRQEDHEFISKDELRKALIKSERHLSEFIHLLFKHFDL